jgi:hypothetical protein
MARGVTPQDVQLYMGYMQQQAAQQPMAPGLSGQMGGPPHPSTPPQGYDKGGLVSKINPFYTYSVGLRNLHKLDDNPAVQNGDLPVAPALGPAMQPVGLSSLVPQEPGHPVDPTSPDKMNFARGGIVNLGLQQRMAQAMRYYTGMGYSPAQAAGIVGNLTAESSLNPSAVGDKGTSFGMMQAHNERAQALRNYGGSNWRDFQTQLGFVPHELSGPESAAGRALNKAQNVEQATQAMIGYERPQGWTADNPTAGHNYSGRLNYANQAYNLYTGTPAANVSPDITNTGQANMAMASSGAAQQAAQASQAMDAMAQAAQAQAATSDAAAASADTSDPLGGLMGLMMMGQQQQAPAPAPAPTTRRAQPVDPQYQTAITSQTPDAYADYLRRRQQMMGA